MRNRYEDARLDEAIYDATLRASGVIEDDEPTAFSHAVYMRRLNKEMFGEFTPQERRDIRALLLGFGPLPPTVIS